MKILALVPARGGSKRLPRKNIKSLGGKPLIIWTIDLALSLSDLCDVLVSTDSEEIAAVSIAAGASVPWLRPGDLATDTASSLDVTLHALDWYEAQHGEVDGILLLQPTSPFRTRAMMEEGLSLFRRNGGRAVIGVAPAATHPLWALRLEGDELRPYVAGDNLKARAQDLPPAFAVTGSFYLVKPNALRAGRTFFPADAQPLHVSPREALDVDTQEDFELAEALLAVRARESE